MATVIEDSDNVASIQLMNDLSVGSAINDNELDNMNDIFDRPHNNTAASPLQTAMHSTSRMVSLSSMSALGGGSSSSHLRKRPAETTPYNSLREQIKNKHKPNHQQHQEQRALQRCDSAPQGFSGPSTVAPVAKPSLFLRRALYSQQAETTSPLPKRRKTQSAFVPSGESDLHQACANKDCAEIAKIVEQDRVQAARAIRITSTKIVYNMGTNQLEEKQVEENYTFALNLAIRSKVDATALEVLAKAAPGVLATEDGDAQEGSLSILLKTSPEDMATVDSFMLKNPDCVRVADRNGNLPLHVACRSGAALDTIRHLVMLYPEALFLHNRWGETPLMSAQRSSRCSEKVAEYLWEKQAASF